MVEDDAFLFISSGRLFYQFVEILFFVDNRDPSQPFCQAAATNNTRFLSTIASFDQSELC